MLSESDMFPSTHLFAILLVATACLSACVPSLGSWYHPNVVAAASDRSQLTARAVRIYAATPLVPIAFHRADAAGVAHATVHSALRE